MTDTDMKMLGYMLKGIAAELPGDAKRIIDFRVEEMTEAIDLSYPMDLIAFGIVVSLADWNSVSGIDVDEMTASLAKAKDRMDRLDAVPEQYDHKSFMAGFDKGWGQREAEMFNAVEAAGPTISLDRIDAYMETLKARIDWLHERALKYPKTVSWEARECEAKHLAGLLTVHCGAGRGMSS